jgi:hypothetical protein
MASSANPPMHKCFTSVHGWLINPTYVPEQAPVIDLADLRWEIFVFVSSDIDAWAFSRGGAAAEETIALFNHDGKMRVKGVKKIQLDNAGNVVKLILITNLKFRHDVQLLVADVCTKMAVFTDDGDEYDVQFFANEKKARTALGLGDAASPGTWGKEGKGAGDKVAAALTDSDKKWSARLEELRQSNVAATAAINVLWIETQTAVKEAISGVETMCKANTEAQQKAADEDCIKIRQVQEEAAAVKSGARTRRSSRFVTSPRSR